MQTKTGRDGQHASHIVSFEVLEKVRAAAGRVLSPKQALDTAWVVQAENNMRIKTDRGPTGNLRDTDREGQSYDDSTLDKEIMRAMDAVAQKQTPTLSRRAAKRFRRQAGIVLRSKNALPPWLIRKFREIASHVIDPDGHKIVRKNAAISQAKLKTSVDRGCKWYRRRLIVVLPSGRINPTSRCFRDGRLSLKILTKAGEIRRNAPLPDGLRLNKKKSRHSGSRRNGLRLKQKKKSRHSGSRRSDSSRSRQVTGAKRKIARPAHSQQVTSRSSS